MKFSDTLIKDTKEYFLRRHKRPLSDKEAQDCLERLAQLGMLILENEQIIQTNKHHKKALTQKTNEDKIKTGI